MVFSDVVVSLILSQLYVGSNVCVCANIFSDFDFYVTLSSIAIAQ